MSKTSASLAVGGLCFTEYKCVLTEVQRLFPCWRKAASAKQTYTFHRVSRPFESPVKLISDYPCCILVMRGYNLCNRSTSGKDLIEVYLNESYRTKGFKMKYIAIFLLCIITIHSYAQDQGKEAIKRSTGYYWGEPRLRAFVEEMLVEAKRARDDRLEQVARRFMR